MHKKCQQVVSSSTFIAFCFTTLQLYFIQERRRAYTTVENYSENNTSNESLSFSRIIVKKSSTDINTSSEFGKYFLLHH